eukprot:Skav222934  [mRNA]  locus=scaffold1489:422169:432863:+ [translate_table: standard]
MAKLLANPNKALRQAAVHAMSVAEVEVAAKADSAEDAAESLKLADENDATEDVPVTFIPCQELQVNEGFGRKETAGSPKVNDLDLMETAEICGTEQASCMVQAIQVVAVEDRLPSRTVSFSYQGTRGLPMC